MTPNLEFKVTPLFDADCLINGTIEFKVTPLFDADCLINGTR